MCEPTHSIIQYPNDPDIAPRVGVLGSWVNRVLDWLHLSKLGKGHSEAIKLTPAGRLFLPEPVLYEGYWWNRTVRLDSYKRSEHHALALEAAEEYSKRVVIGNLSLLRRFLETSMRRTDYPGKYIETFRDKMLNSLGKRNMDDKIKIIKRSVETSIKVMLGATRKREWLVPEWADDSKLWLPT